MSKYQFFSKPGTNHQEFTYLDMGSDSYLNEKSQLLDIGFHVEGDTINADSSESAVDKFKLSFCSSLDDYSNSTAAGGLATFIFESFKAVMGKNS